MLALIYVFAISFAAAILYVSVDWFETNRRLALVLKLVPHSPENWASIPSQSAAIDSPTLLRLNARREGTPSLRR